MPSKDCYAEPINVDLLHHASSPPTHLFRQAVEVMEEGVVGGGGDAAHVAHLLGLPGSDKHRK